MFWLIIGLILFLGAHSVRIVAPDFRQRFMESRGDNAWKGLYTLVSLAGLILIIWGFSIARYGPIIYDPPLWMRYITELLMLFAFISLAVSSVPAGKLKPALKHPMLLSVKIWALAHLLANGDLASLLLFGSFLVWAVADRISEKRRLKAGITQPTEPGPVRNDVIAVIVGVVVYGLFIWKLHYWLIGVPVHA
ncbi:NnrU family protein [Hoeflea sp. WL0058]|uniref:NnrU family protein n=1 Tax=Flavimaribacter sediminis TaxID=2865987 RepID=A0AAE3D3L5_9HYPH|nr:NnrU family protein [Flavimaribacter sediminis]MBW8640237.1 NnrU family protein [Flavimaribacter sediminis]